LDGDAFADAQSSWQQQQQQAAGEEDDAAAAEERYMKDLWSDPARGFMSLHILPSIM
jgi:hypothetical protein